MSATDPRLYYIPAGSRLADDRFTAAEREILTTLNQRVAAGESLAAIMDFVFETGHALFPCDRLAVAFLDPTGTRLTTHWLRADYAPAGLPGGYTQDLRDSSLSPVIARGEIRLIGDLAGYGQQHPGSVATRALVAEGVRSNLTCPLRVDGRSVGVLFRSARRVDAYSEHEALLQYAFVERLAQAVEKAYRIDQLAETNRAYLEMLGFVSHELKAPLANMVMDAEVLLRNRSELLTPGQRERVVRIQRQAHGLAALIRDYLDLARLEGVDVVPHLRPDVDVVRDICEPAIETVAAALADHGRRIERRFADPVPPITADPDLLRIVLVNLLDNAVKYGRSDTPITLFAQQDSDGSLVIRVRNEGPGFPPETRGQLFKRFSRLQTPEQRGIRGSGVGLYTCWRLIQAHHGHIDARSEPGQWAEFSFSLPARP